MSQTQTISHPVTAGPGGLVDRLNTAWHERALQIFMAIVLLHWAEHLTQAYQLYAMGWTPPEALGFFGLYAPWLVSSEILHYGYALVMLGGLWFLRTGFTGQSYTWWMMSFWIQFWHHFEHLLLQGQAVVGENLFNAPVPVSILQLWIRRPELHLIYNTAVFIPMIVAMYYHMFPSEEDARSQQCSCAVHSTTAAA